MKRIRLRLAMAAVVCALLAAACAPGVDGAVDVASADDGAVDGDADGAGTDGTSAEDAGQAAQRDDGAANNGAANNGDTDNPGYGSGNDPNSDPNNNPNNNPSNNLGEDVTTGTEGGAGQNSGQPARPGQVRQNNQGNQDNPSNAGAGSQGTGSQGASRVSSSVSTSGSAWQLTGGSATSGNGNSCNCANPSTTGPSTSGPSTTGPSTAQRSRPAVVVKIDNHVRARPQFGLNEADVVYEQIVEFGLTRFAAVYHSADAETVGPVRSVRTSDFALLEQLGAPLLASSGGIEDVLEGLNSLEVTDVGLYFASSAYWRQAGRLAPHNLMANTVQLREIAATGRFSSVATSPPGPLFDYRSDTGLGNVSNPTASVSGVDLNFGETNVNYRWAPDAQAWWRTQNGVLHLDAQGQVVAPENVIVQFVVYGRSTADPRSPHAELSGSGEAWIFTNGGLVRGNWTRPETGSAGNQGASSRTVYTDLAGNSIELTPGKTWVALVRVGQARVVR